MSQFQNLVQTETWLLACLCKTPILQTLKKEATPNILQYCHELRLNDLGKCILRSKYLTLHLHVSFCCHLVGSFRTTTH